MDHTDALKELHAALNRNDVRAAVQAFDPDIEWIEPPEYPMGGTYNGLPTVEAHLSRARASWAEGSCQPERFLVSGDEVIVVLYIKVRLKHETEWREGRHAEVYTFRHGKVVQMRIFPDEDQALAWAQGDQNGTFLPDYKETGTPTQSDV